MAYLRPNNFYRIKFENVPLLNVFTGKLFLKDFIQKKF